MSVRGSILALFCGLIVLTAATTVDGARPHPPSMDVILSERLPARLSEYGLFEDLRTLRPAVGVRGYALATPLFTDYLDKSRFVFVPEGAQANYRPDEVFDFPVGAVLVKNFGARADPADPASPTRWIETRLLIRKRNGWVAAPYVWEASGADARLDVAGSVQRADVFDGRGQPLVVNHAIPNRNQCKGCHAVSGAVSPIGPRARNLNVPQGHDPRSQIEVWTAAGLLAGAPAAADAPIAPRWDADGGIAERARAYLDVNCAHCHNPSGPASNTGLDLRATQTDPAAWGVRRRPVSAGRASGDAFFDIVPGHPDRSILVTRMESLDPGVMMPELGRSVRHDEGIALVRAWIAAMDEHGAVR